MSEIALQEPLEYTQAPSSSMLSDNMVALSMASLLLGTGLAAFSWLAGGIAVMNNGCFLLFTAAMVMLTLRELFLFTTNFAVARLVLYLGVLLFFCQDYLSRYLFPDPEKFELKLGVIGKGAFYHGLFILCATWAVHKRGIRWFSKALELFKEPRSASAYLPVIGLCTIVGLAPLIFFTRGSFFTAFYLSVTGGRAFGADFILRSRGNLASNWDSYIFFIYKIGDAGAIFGMYYALFLTNRMGRRLFCFFNWMIWLSLAFGTGGRGAVLVLLVPTVVFVFLRYQSETAALLRKMSYKAYIYSVLVLAFGFVIVQTQITYRNMGFADVSLEEVNLATPAGNEMFSESLPGFEHVPKDQPYFYDDVPGETIVAPVIVEGFFWFSHPIPRVIWPSKPIDPAWHWYNQLHTGREGYEGTTIATGLVGYWYLRYGLFGVIQGGLIFGAMLASIDTSFRRCLHRPFTTLLCAGMLMIMFRMFRSFGCADFWGMVIGFTGMWIIVRVVDRVWAPSEG